jgi:hypothetical protein
MRRPILRLGCFALRHTLCVAAIVSLVSLPAGRTFSQDWVRQDREVAKTWAMHRIAVIQAADGDVQGAKRTVSQIGDVIENGAVDVTAVWFVCGQPVYCRPCCAQAGAVRPMLVAPPQPHGTLRFWEGQPAPRPDVRAGRVPSKVPSGLPADYLAADPRHGAVVDFSDDRDSQGTRITSRTYADGHAVIETPRQGS